MKNDNKGKINKTDSFDVDDHVLIRHLTYIYLFSSDSDYLLGSDSDGMHRRAIFSTSIEPDRDKYNVKSTCK